MNSYTLKNLIKNLSASPQVRSIFTTGTTASGYNPSSDIDLVVILDNNRENVKSIYTTIENRFADIFFYDVDFVKKLHKMESVNASSFEGMFIGWLTKGKIEYDTDDILKNFKTKIIEHPPQQTITEQEKRDFWIKVNYNLIANTRYYESKDTLYHEALEIRLLYSVIELITAYFSFRNVPWRGEKTAVKYFKEHDQEYYSIFQKCVSSSNLEEKIKQYTLLAESTFFGEFKKWPSDFVIGISNKTGFDANIAKWWMGLFEDNK